MTVKLRCPHCHKTADVPYAPPLSSGNTFKCPLCAGEFKLDICRFAAQPRPVQMRRALAVEAV